jgi:hypothetical protein
MTISQIVSTTEKSTKPPPSTMRSQKCNERSRRRHSARAPFIVAQLTAAMKRGLRRERNGSCLRERLRQPRQHQSVSVKRDPLKTTDAKRCQTVLVLERTELALDRGTTPLERAPTLRAVRDQRVHS